VPFSIEAVVYRYWLLICIIFFSSLKVPAPLYVRLFVTYNDADFPSLLWVAYDYAVLNSPYILGPFCKLFKYSVKYVTFEFNTFLKIFQFVPIGSYITWNVLKIWNSIDNCKRHYKHISGIIKLPSKIYFFWSNSQFSQNVIIPR